MNSLTENSPLVASASAPAHVLVADDQSDVIEALRLLLKGHGYQVATAGSPEAVLEAVGCHKFDLLLIDLNYARDTTSGREGLDLLAQLQSNADVPPIVVMTGWATVALAVEAMQRGVGDFIEKPWDNAKLLEILRAQIERHRARLQDSVRAAAAESRRRAMETAHAMEIDEALRVQQGFLPRELPQIAGFELASAWRPARGVGGDAFDVLPLDPSIVALCIADVAGKGVPAALLMSNLQAMVRGLSSPHTSPREFCTEISRALHGSLAEDRFVTCFYALLDVPARRLRYTNAGHNPPLLIRANGSFARLEEGGSVLGIDASACFGEQEIQLFSGDRLLLFTDGVTELTRENGEEYGEARLLSLCIQQRALPAATLHQRLLDSLVDFNHGEFQDDMTLIVLGVI